GSADASLRLWELPVAPRLLPRPARGRVAKIGASRERDRLMFWDFDDQIQLLDLDDGHLRALPVEREFRLGSMVDGRGRLFIGPVHGEIKLVDENGISRTLGSGHTAALSVDGATAAIADGRRIRVVQVAGGKELASFEVPFDVTKLRLGPD